MTIQVTDEDIKAGRPSDPQYCPIAEAIKRRRLGTDDFLGVCELFIEFNNIYYSTPRKVRRFINDFDAAKPVAPFQFVLRKRFKVPQ